MTEYTIAVEGEVSVDGRLVRPGALTWETPMPVFGPRDEDSWSSPICGTIESIRRVEGEDGRSLLQAQVSWYGEEPVGTGLCAQVENAENDFVDEGHGLLTFVGGRIRAAFLGTPAWPDTMIHE